MTKEIKQYIAEIERILAEDAFHGNWSRLKKEMLIRIGFYQHERLIHLIVTSTFAIMTILAFYLSFNEPMFLWLAGLFLLLDIPYIAHYYFLENSVQKLYKYYYIVQGKAEESDI